MVEMPAKKVASNSETPEVKSFLSSLKGTNRVSDKMGSGEVKNFTDTGAYVLNLLVSGSLFRGIPHGRILGLAGEPATGKTFIALGLVKEFLDRHPNAEVVHADTESAVYEQMLLDRGIDASRVGQEEPITIEEFRTKFAQILDQYGTFPEKTRPPLMLTLDSMGMLSTNKEIGDITEGKDVQDMTKQKLLKGAFRVMTQKCGRLQVPMVVTNHVYDSMDGSNKKTMSGGSGLKFAASIIIFLTTKQDEAETNAIKAKKQRFRNATILIATLEKGRFSKPGRRVEMRLSFDRGLDRYYGLLELAVEHGMVEGKMGRFQIGGGTFTKNEIYRQPTRFFTQEWLEQLEAIVSPEYSYGGKEEIEALEDEDDDVTDTTTEE